MNNGCNNLWSKTWFKGSKRDSKIPGVGKIKQFFRSLKWSYQRAVRGYSEPDIWGMSDFLMSLIPDMLQDLRNDWVGSPALSKEGKEGDSEEQWNATLDKMIFLWREAKEETCSKKNPFDEEYTRALGEFNREYGFFGEKLNHAGEKNVVHFMDEIPKFKEISDKYLAKENMIDEYREKCRNEALDMMKQHFDNLWD